LKTKFLVAYDYDCGGIWRVIDANDKSDITEQYPELTIIAERPDWMTEERLADLEMKSINIENKNDLFFTTLLSQRNINNDR